MADSETDVGHEEPTYEHFEVIQALGISEEAANEVSTELGDGLDMVKDLTYDGRYYIVRWHDAE